MLSSSSSASNLKSWWILLLSGFLINLLLPSFFADAGLLLIVLGLYDWLGKLWPKGPQLVKAMIVVAIVIAYNLQVSLLAGEVPF